MKSGKTNLDWFARAMLWSIRRQDSLSALVRGCVYAALMLVTGLGLLKMIPVETALRFAFYGGMVISCALWLFIDRRRAWLLGIRNPELKKHAHRTMLSYLAERGDGIKVEKTVSREVKSERTNECSDC